MASRIRNTAWLLVLSIGCGDLAEPPSGSEKSSPVRVTTLFDPPPIEGRVAPIFHLQLSGLSPGALPPTLLEGNASEQNIRDIAKDEIGETLRKRMVETTAWVREDRTWIIVPTRSLRLADRYSVVAPSANWSEPFDVVDRDDVRVMSRIWPPSDAGGELAVWCLGWPTTGAVVAEPLAVALLPAAPGTLDRGALEGIGEGCVRWRPDAFVRGTAVPAPMMTMSDGELVRVDPSPILLEDGSTQFVPPACGEQEQPVGPLCVRVLDDRAVVSVQDSTWLIGLEIGERWAATVGPNEPWVVRPLQPSSLLTGRMWFVSSSGTEQRLDVSWETSPPSPHVVINEVMANPAGPEPHQEWVELYNDGVLDVPLAGWTLEDAGGATELPSVVLPAGGFGLVVGEGYDPDSWVDKSPAPGALLIRVDSLAKSGISNGGEPLRLLRSDGVTASSVPAIASKEQGRSIARVAPDALDGLSRSFGFGPDGGSPGQGNEAWVVID